MACYAPLRAYRSEKRTTNGKRALVFNRNEGFSDQPIDIPCGKCIGCRLEYARQWAMRCMHEASLHEENCFLTLTYNDENLPYGCTLVKKDVQDFMKRLRYHTGLRLRFYLCGEYGDEDLRPHYHACIFGYDAPDKKFLRLTPKGHKLYTSPTVEKIWKHGYITVGSVSFESAGYCARYVTKKIVGEKAAEAYWRMDERTGVIYQVAPEFALMSRNGGIGKEWIDRYGLEVYRHDSVIVNGQEVLPPKFYDNQLSDDKLQQIKDARIKRGAPFRGEKTLSRLRVREEVKQAQTARLKRS